MRICGIINLFVWAMIVLQTRNWFLKSSTKIKYDIKIQRLLSVELIGKNFNLGHSNFICCSTGLNDPDNLKNQLKKCISEPLLSTLHVCFCSGRH